MKNVTVIFLLVPFLLSCHNPAAPDIVVVDIDGNEYKTVWLGNQVWMAENLRVTHYRNGDPIPLVVEPSKWSSLTTGARAHYLNGFSNGQMYGNLYNWYAVNDERGLCPLGWRVPDEEDWIELRDFLGGNEIAGGKMKSLERWRFPNYGATNESGWTGLPGGYRGGGGGFSFIRERSFWWFTTEAGGTQARYGVLAYYDQRASIFTTSKRNGHYVRCVMN